MPLVKSLCVTRDIVSVTWHYSATWHCNAMCQYHHQMSLCWFRFSSHLYFFVSI